MSVVYYIGAGASIDAIPIVSGLKSKLIEFEKFLSQNNFSPTSNQNKNLVKLGSLISDLIRGCNSYNTIDTYFRFKFLKKELTEIVKLKHAFSIFLSWVQLTKDVDKRYLGFFASTLNKEKLELVPQVSIISWNYDFQFELAYSRIFNIPLSESFNRLKCHSKGFHFSEKSKIIKINGTCGFASDYTELPNFFHLEKSVEIKNLENSSFHLGPNENQYNFLANQSEILNTDKISSINFSWDSFKTINKNTLEIALNEVKKANAIVIIGYSFPEFNLEVDRFILSNAPSTCEFYIQDPEQAISVESRLKSIIQTKKVTLIQEKKPTQFYIPKEYYHSNELRKDFNL